MENHFLTCPTSEVTELPACSHCGARRDLEFQLMPALVSMLRSANLGKKALIYSSLWVSGTNLGLINENLVFHLCFLIKYKHYRKLGKLELFLGHILLLPFGLVAIKLLNICVQAFVWT